MSRVNSLGVFSIVLQFAKAMVVAAGIIVLSRLLTPFDFGVVALGVVFVSFCALVQEFGATNSLIQSRRLLRRQARSAAVVLMWGSVMIAALGLAAVPWFAAWMGTPELSQTLPVMMLAVLANGIAIVPRAILFRCGRFTTVSTVEFVATVAGTATSIFVAAAVWSSFWAIVIGHLVTSAFTSIHFVVATRFWKGPRGRFELPANFRAFAGGLTPSDAVAYANGNLESLVLGATSGAATVGLYERAARIVRFWAQNINAPLAKIAVSKMSREQRSGSGGGGSVETLAVLCIGLFPLSLVGSLYHEEVTMVLLGPQFAAASGVLMWLALRVSLTPVGSAISWRLVSTGQLTRLFIINLTALLTNLWAVWAGASEGLTAVARNLFIVALIRIPLVYLAESRNSLHRSIMVPALFASPVFIANGILWGWPHLDNVRAIIASFCVLTCGIGALLIRKRLR